MKINLVYTKYIKIIYTKSSLRNNFCKKANTENEKNYKIERDKCVKNTSIKKYFKNN